jgi:DNA-binding PadR family transcriptional regulator
VPRVVEPHSSLRQLGRFSEPGLLVMISLADGPKHGYAMLEDIEALAGVRLGPGTLYGALARLERLGLIAPLAPVERRRPYELTQAGVRVLHTELATWQNLASTGLRRLHEVVPA